MAAANMWHMSTDIQSKNEVPGLAHVAAMCDVQIKAYLHPIFRCLEMMVLATEQLHVVWVA